MVGLSFEFFWEVPNQAPKSQVQIELIFKIANGSFVDALLGEVLVLGVPRLGVVSF